MSLQKIGKYTEIFECSRKLQRPTKFDDKRVMLIQNIAIAGLIEAGAPYTAENGEIIIDTGIDYKSVFINDVFQYLSPESQMKVMVENAKMVELPAPQRPYSISEAQASPAPQSEEVKEFSSEAFKREEFKKEPMKMMEGLEDYESDSFVSETTVVVQPDQEPKPESTQAVTVLKEEQTLNEKWESLDKPAPHIEPGSGEAITVKEASEQSARNDEIAGYSAELANVNLSDASEQFSYKNSETHDETVFEDTMQEEAQQEQHDVMELSKYGITFERCNLEITRNDGSVVRFAVHSAPLTDINDINIIARLKLVGENGGYMHTAYGEEPTFVYEDLVIKMKKDMRNDGIFSCSFASDNPSVMINKINVENGGNQGNLVIFDENLEIRIYPFQNVRNKETGKMEFGNNKKGEAAFLYYIKNGDEIIASSGAERPAKFIYEEANIAIRAKWDKEKIVVGAEVIE